jgi:hypothetical protein
MSGRSRRCFRRLVLIGAFAFIGFLPCLGAALTASGGVTLSGFNFSNGTIPVPKWSNGAVIAIEGQTTLAPTLHVFDSRGNYLRTVPFSLDGATWLLVRGYSSGPDGTIALCGQAKDAQGQVEHFLAILPPDPAAAPKIVRTYPYSPASVAIAPDGTIWTMGIEYQPIPGKMLGGKIRPQADVLRHFDHEGNQIGAFIPQASVGRLQGALSNLAAASGRSGWYPGGGNSYVEIASDGSVHQYPSLTLGPGENVNGLAITENGAVFLSAINSREGTERVFQLDRPQRTWEPVHLALPGPVVGANGNTVAIAVSGGSMSIEFFPSN